jgi:DNA-binding response OmpR family regulator
VDSGEKALELIAAERPAGVLLDLGLPGISGMEVLRRLKSDPATAEIPVYIMSGAADTGEARTLGAAGYIRKPITRDAVLRGDPQHARRHAGGGFGAGRPAARPAGRGRRSVQPGGARAVQGSRVSSFSIAQGRRRRSGGDPGRYASTP